MQATPSTSDRLGSNAAKYLRLFDDLQNSGTNGLQNTALDSPEVNGRNTKSKKTQFGFRVVQWLQLAFSNGSTRVGALPFRRYSWRRRQIEPPQLCGVVTWDDGHYCDSYGCLNALRLNVGSFSDTPSFDVFAGQRLPTPSGFTTRSNKYCYFFHSVPNMLRIWSCMRMLHFSVPGLKINFKNLLFVLKSP
jgi:hypothetical protein